MKLRNLLAIFFCLITSQFANAKTPALFCSEAVGETKKVRLQDSSEEYYSQRINANAVVYLVKYGPVIFVEQCFGKDSDSFCSGGTAAADGVASSRTEVENGIVKTVACSFSKDKVEAFINR